MPKRSLRANLALGVVAMLMPWVMFILVEGQLLFPRIIGAFEGVVRTTGPQMHSIMALDKSVQRSAAQVNEYLIDREPVRRERFADLSHQVEERFAAVQGNYRELPRQRQQLQAARQAWQQARNLGGQLLTLTPPFEQPKMASTFRRMNSYVDEVQRHLNQIHDFVRQQANRKLGQAHDAARDIRLLNASIFVVAMIMAAVSGFGLARAILVPLRKLEEGATRLGAGDLEHRVEVEGNDELTQLAGTFNTMAERLQHTQLTLEEMAARDGLTGLYNHNEFLRRLDVEIGRYQRYGRPFTVLMLDLDHFKRVNDAHGHQAGDEVLRTITGRIQVELRPTDQLARYGGEEFAIILAETAGATALKVAQRLCDVVRCCAIEIPDDRTVTITISIGVAAFPEDADSAEGLVAAADRALYAAKEGGRNQAVRFSSNISFEVQDNDRSAPGT